MLLKHLYDFAVSRHLLDDLAFSPKAVRWIIELDNTGNLLGSGPQATGDDKRGKEFSCPQTTRPKVAGGVSEFLADGITAVFGLDPDPDAPMTELVALRNRPARWMAWIWLPWCSAASACTSSRCFL